MESVLRDSKTEINRHSLTKKSDSCTDLRNALQGVKNDLENEKKRNHELADLLNEKTKQCAKLQVLSFLDRSYRHCTIN